MSVDILAKRLKNEMEQQNWTGRKLSQKANLSYNAIHYILSGKTKSTNFEVVSAIANVLDVSPFYLLGEENKKTNIKTQKSSKDEVAYDGELYREIMCIVEEILKSKNSLTTDQVEYFTRCSYPQIKKMANKDNIKSYLEGIIDYALNISE